MVFNMDGESDVLRASSAGQPSQLASSTQQLPSIHDQLTSDELGVLSERMEYWSKRRHWDTQIDMTGLDIYDFGDILVALLDELALTQLQRSVIAPQSAAEACRVVESFCHKELEEWTNGSRRGVKDNDWTDLINHRMCCIAFEGSTTSNRCDSQTSNQRTIYI